MFLNRGYSKYCLIFSLVMAALTLQYVAFSYSCQATFFGDTPKQRASCQQAIAQYYTVPEANINLTFGRVDKVLQLMNLA